MDNSNLAVNMTTTTFADGVAARLREIGPMLLGNDILILPSEVRQGRAYYLTTDMNSMRLAEEAGIKAAFLPSEGKRQYLEEFSAEWALAICIAVSQDLLAQGIGGVINYVWACVKFSISERMHGGPPESIPLRFTMAHIEYDANGYPIIRGLSSQGPAGQVLESLRIALTSQHPNNTGPVREVRPASTEANAEEPDAE